MAEISVEVRDRLAAGIRKFQPVLERAREAGRNESDTVTIITDMLSEVFGYDKYENITSELAIKRQFCDLALMIDGQICLLIECKAVGIPLREDHIIQATNYAANAGIEWVALTNGIHWMLYRVVFGRPVEHIMAYDFNFCKMSPDSADDYALLFGLCREAFTPDGNELLEKMFTQRGTINRYIVAQVLLNDWMIDTIRRSVLRHFPSVQLSNNELRRMMHDEIFRQELVDSTAASEAAQIVAAANSRMKAVAREKKSGQ